MDARPARSAGAPEGPALLAGLRDRLLDQVLALLEADPAVAGVALVGSLGRGEEDNWSDIDLLILASDEFIRQFMNDPAASPWARADRSRTAATTRPRVLRHWEPPISVQGCR